MTKDQKIYINQMKRVVIAEEENEKQLSLDVELDSLELMYLEKRAEIISQRMEIVVKEQKLTTQRKIAALGEIEQYKKECKESKK